MAKRWYQSRSVQTAIVTGIFAVITTIIVVVKSQQQTSDVKSVAYIIRENTRLESINLKLTSAYNDLAETYLALSKDNNLTKNERYDYRRLYEETLVKMNEQNKYTLIAKETLVRAQKVLNDLKKKPGETIADSVLFTEECRKYSKLYEETKKELEIQKELSSKRDQEYLNIKNQCEKEVSKLKEDKDQYKELYTIAKAEIAKLDNEKQKSSQPDKIFRITLRSKPRKDLSELEAKIMIVDKAFYDAHINPTAKGINNKYKVQNKGTVITDHATGLMWQKAGSIDSYKNYTSAQEYVDLLNEREFAGYNDWRIPTLEEAMSIMEPQKNEEGIFIDAVFEGPYRVWTSDVRYKINWIVFFDNGYIFCPTREEVGDIFYLFSLLYMSSNTHVRAVRTMK